MSEETNLADDAIDASNTHTLTDSSTPDEDKRQLCIIFDLDGTLVCDTSSTAVLLRPGAIELLETCLDLGCQLGVWTAASESWLEKVVRVLSASFERHIGSQPLFAVKYSAERCSRKPFPLQCVERGELAFASDLEFSSKRTKNLQKIWNRSQLRRLGFTRQTTLIVEDKEDNCWHNYGNAMIVNPYKMQKANGPTAGIEDRDLFVLAGKIRMISEMMQNDKHFDVRVADKSPFNPDIVRRQHHQWKKIRDGQS